MLAYMNEEALKKTIETNETWFYSRSRQELWNKGATSGNKQKVKQIAFDCDQDAILLTVVPAGPACHTGEESCFFNVLDEEKQTTHDVIHRIVQVIENRRQHPVEGAYTTYLFNEGIDKVLKKSEEHTSELQSRGHLVCRLLLEKKKTTEKRSSGRWPTSDAARTEARATTRTPTPKLELRRPAAGTPRLRVGTYLELTLTTGCAH